MSGICLLIAPVPVHCFSITFNRCREEIASAVNGFGNQWCKRESVECNALKEWKLSIFNIVDKCMKFYTHNANHLPPKPKSSLRHLKQGIKNFNGKYVLVPADKAANNVVVVCRVHYINALKRNSIVQGHTKRNLSMRSL